MQRSFNNWRAEQPDGGPTLRQELAYRDGFADALKLMCACAALAVVGDLHQAARDMAQGDQAERV